MGEIGLGSCVISGFDTCFVEISSSDTRHFFVHLFSKLLIESLTQHDIRMLVGKQVEG